VHLSWARTALRMSSHAAEDDSDSLYAREEGETECPAPRPRNHRGEHDYCSDAEHLDNALDLQDAEAKRDAAKLGDAESDADSGSEVSTDSKVVRRAASTSTLDGMEEIEVVSDVDGAGIGKNDAPEVRQVEPTDTFKQEDDEDDDAGFASDENVIDDADDADSDSSDEKTPTRAPRGAMTVMGIAHNTRFDEVGGADSSAASVGTSRWRTGPSAPAMVTSRSSSAIGNGSSRIVGRSTDSGAAALNARDEKSPASGNFFQNIARAGATFYKAAFKPPRPSNQADTSATKGDGKVGDEKRRRDGAAVKRNGATITQDCSTPAARKAVEVQSSHHRLISMIDAQIATLNGAKAGFVDLSVLKPMTERTRSVIEEEVMGLFDNFGKLEQRIAILEQEIAAIDKKTEEDVCEKEQVLIAAKLNMAEAQGEVINMKHDLAGVRKELNDPGRIAAKVRAQLRARSAAARASAVVAMDARKAAEENVESRRRQLEIERTAAKRLEAGCKDMDGDWA
jgi:hypothetical protein